LPLLKFQPSYEFRFGNIFVPKTFILMQFLPNSDGGEYICAPISGFVNNMRIRHI